MVKQHHVEETRLCSRSQTALWWAGMRICTIVSSWVVNVLCKQDKKLPHLERWQRWERVQRSNSPRHQMTETVCEHLLRIQQQIKTLIQSPLDLGRRQLSISQKLSERLAQGHLKVPSVRWELLQHVLLGVIKIRYKLSWKVFLSILC